MLNRVKDLAYKGIVKVEAEALVERLGNKEAIIAYLGGEEKSTVKIPDRKSAYELLYECLMERLDEEDAVKLLQKRDLFILRKKVSILWENFEDKQLLRTQQKELEVLLEEQTTKQRQLDKALRIEEKIQARKTGLEERLTEIAVLLGKGQTKDESSDAQAKESIIELSKDLAETPAVEPSSELETIIPIEEPIEKPIEKPIEEPIEPKEINVPLNETEPTKPKVETLYSEQQKALMEEQEALANFHLLETELYGKQTNEDVKEPLETIGSNF